MTNVDEETRLVHIRGQLIRIRERLIERYRKALAKDEWEKAQAVERRLYAVDGRLADILREMPSAKR